MGDIDLRLCEYGCGREAKYTIQLKHSKKFCCSPHYSSCPKNIKTWNKGLTKESDNRVLKYSKNKIGKSSWNKGLTKENDERVRRISLSNIGKKNTDDHNKKISIANKGKNKSKDTIAKIREKLKGKPAWNKGLTKEINKSLRIVSLKLTKENKKSYVKKLTRNNRIKHSKFNLYLKRYSDFFNYEYLEEDYKTKDLFVKCSMCGIKFKQKNYKILYRAYMIKAGKCDKGLFYCSDNCKKVFINKYKKEYEIYSCNVWRETYRSIKRYKNKIYNIELRGRKYKYHLDHKFSIIEGFKNKIDYKIIGNWRNLEVIPEIENIRKLGRCSISIEKLIEEINKETNSNN